MMNNKKISSKRQFHWTTKISNIEEKNDTNNVSSFLQEPQKILNSLSKKHQNDLTEAEAGKSCHPRRKKILQAAVAVSRLQAVLNSFVKSRASRFQRRLVLGTLFGNKRGNVHLAFQKDAKSTPILLVELATPITGLVREMGPGLVRIAFECDNRGRTSQVISLLDEPAWRTYCNGNKLGFATKVECGEKEWKILKAVEPISMGAGVLGKEKEEDEEVIYMRAKFERVVGTANSEAFYMINPDNKAAPELSVYFLRA
ncbi:protein MIZU-KUSSEI 1-like [Primulina huaijiensis]|uniref:protein MIZU-KUSSEI 1-like n=1 Tax=Primulina huaijiensis TaxID=1492673 RepID=UPI003CC6E13D